MISGTTAVSACISPSTISDGSRWWRSSTARRTLSASEWRVLPKLENDSMATRGSTLNRRAISAVQMAISARSSALGSMFTVQSARKYTSPLAVMSM